MMLFNLRLVTGWLCALMPLTAFCLPAAETNAPEYQFIPKPLYYSVKNPLTGWRGKREVFKKGEAIDDGYETLKKWYIGWNELESSESDTVEKMAGFFDDLWQDLPARNEKAIPRIVLVDARGSYVPKDLPPFPSIKENWRESAWYTNPAVQPRIERLIHRVGQLWDRDPRVAFVEMGIQGKYAEQWGLAQMPDFARWLCREFTNAFPNKKILFRSIGTPAWGKDTSVYKEIGKYFHFGYYMDSFGYPTYVSELKAIAALDGGHRWEYAVMGGEIRAERNTNLNAATLINNIRSGHVNHQGWDMPATPKEFSEMDTLRAAFGYHFVITDYHQPLRVEPGQTLAVSFKVKNTGSSPFYYRWPVKVSLVDEATRETVLSQRLDSVDIRTWLPGDEWNVKKQAYAKPPKEYPVQASLPLPAALKPGNYVVTLAVLDPEGGNLPSVRFEIENYWPGGWHPMGRVGVGVDNPHPALDPATFYLDSVDASVHYIVPKSNQAPFTHEKQN